MQIYPAIDIKNGQCVRLRQGQFHDVNIYSSTPIKIARMWEEQGATYIHLVDLDGALIGHSINQSIIQEIVQSVKVLVQVGGGVRTINDIEAKLKVGVERVIIGTKAVENQAFIKEAISTFGSDKIVIGIDAKEGMVAIEGWGKISSYTAISLAMQMKDIGVKTIVYTDITKDGMLSGPNIDSTLEMVEKTGLNIIASGGVSSLKDLEKVNETNVQGAIIGKALYENKFNLSDAIRIFEKGE